MQKRRKIFTILLIFSTSSSFGFASRMKTEDVVELEKVKKSEGLETYLLLRSILRWGSCGFGLKAGFSWTGGFGNSKVSCAIWVDWVKSLLIDSYASELKTNTRQSSSKGIWGLLWPVFEGGGCKGRSIACLWAVWAWAWAFETRRWSRRGGSVALDWSRRTTRR